MHQGAGGAHQGLAVIDLAGALGHEGHRAGPGPVAAGSPGILRVFRTGRIAGHAGEEGSPLIAAVFHTLRQDRIGLDRLRHKARNILLAQGRHDGRDARPLRLRLRNADQDAGRHFQQAAAAGGIRIIHMGRAFQHAQGGEPGTAVRGGFVAHKDDGAADAHGHGGGLDVQALVLIQAFLHIQEQGALGEAQADMVILLDELHLAGGVQSDDL